MFGKKSRLSPLESRKRLLVAESELNRAQLLEQWHGMSERIHNFGDRAKSLGSVVSSAAVLAAALAAFRRRKSTDDVPKSSRLQTILKSAGSISTLWLAFRASRHDQRG